jgi:hypothetical protein
MRHGCLLLLVLAGCAPSAVQVSARGYGVKVQFTLHAKDHHDATNSKETIRAEETSRGASQSQGNQNPGGRVAGDRPQN